MDMGFRKEGEMVVSSAYKQQRDTIYPASPLPPRENPTCCLPADDDDDDDDGGYGII
jgi:hypothetical protein